MSHSFVRAFRLSATASVAAIALLPALAMAQGGAPEDAAGEADTDIVVTGTLLRGAAPVGQAVISAGPQQVQEQGATTANELLATIPQVSNLFNNVPTSRLSVAANQIQVVRPNLRSLSPETGSSSSTLVLFDGHRVAGVGVTQSATDPDLIPTGAIERVEVVTDGGSATYGSDAVGGVINFITRKRFDGLKVDARYGFADDYKTYDANVIAGKDWGSGSLYAAYMFQKNDALFGRDRDFIRQVDYSTAALTPTGRQCAQPNVVLPGAFSFATFTFGPSTNYAAPNLATPGFNACDQSDNSSYVPRAERHSGIVSLHQELNDSITVDLRAFYAQRKTRSTSELRTTATVARTNAFYIPAAANPTATQTVNLNLAPVLGIDSAPSTTRFEEWGANAEITANLDDNWQVRSLFNYSQSDSVYQVVGASQTLLAAAASASNPQAAVNFYNLAATPNLNLIRAIANSEIAGQGKDELLNLRTIIDGRLFALPGGDVRVAVGYEYLSDSFRQRVAPPNAVIGAYRNVPFTPYNRHVHSVFGEVQVPIVGDGNAMPGIHSLIISGSVRHDRFSDFGDTTNPKFGITWKPVHWLGLRGNYSTSFNAPGAVDQLGSLRNSLSFFPFNAFVRPGDVPTVSGTVAIQGATPNLVPQTAKTWSVGFDVDPPFIPGLHASASYYHVKFSNLLGIPTPSAAIFTDFPNNITANVNGLTPAQLRAFAALAPNGPSVIEPLIAANQGVYEAVLFLVGNYGDLTVGGIDFAVNYATATGFGGIDASVSGNYTLDRKSRRSATTPVIDVLAFDSSRLALQATLGVNIGNFRTQATLNHSSGFKVPRSANLPQDRVGAFNTVNLFFKYDVPGESAMLKDLSFTVNVNNVFDQDPPQYNLINGPTASGYNNGFTIGRLVMLGVSKKF